MIINILSLVFLIIITVTFILLLFWMWTIINSKVPFISVPNKVLFNINQNINLGEDSIVYDLGSGDGKVLFYLAAKNSNSKFIGIENNAFAYFISKVTLFLSRKKNINFIYNDFNKIDLSKATHIFTYLYPNIMDEVLPKIEAEVKKNTILLSASFKFTRKKEKKEIDLNRKKYELVKKLYIYEF